jgi:hypothetical protein
VTPIRVAARVLETTNERDREVGLLRLRGEVNGDRTSVEQSYHSALAVDVMRWRVRGH